jgi:hypothetical protein
MGGRETTLTAGAQSSVTATTAPLRRGVRLLLQPATTTAPFLTAGIAVHIRLAFCGEERPRRVGIAADALWEIEDMTPRTGKLNVPKGGQELLDVNGTLLLVASSMVRGLDATQIETPTVDVARSILTILYHQARAAVGESLRHEATLELDHMDVLRDLEAFNPRYVLDGETR